MKKTILLSLTMLLFLACETGVKNQKTTHETVKSGIVERSENSYSYSKGSYSTKGPSKIFSKSAQPGFYLQMAVFAKTRPGKEFLRPLDRSSFNYIVLNKYSKDYVLIGAYKSYNDAKNKISLVKKTLGKDTFVVQVLRP